MSDDYWHCKQFVTSDPNPIIVCEREDLLAEIERLRAALREINEMDRAIIWRCSSDCLRTGHHDELCEPIDEIRDTVRRALGETE